MKLNQTSKDLLASARYTERHCFTTAPTIHLLDCINYWRRSNDLAAVRITRYHSAAKRLFDCIGTDLADFTKDEAIDMLVAAAFWDVP